MSGRDPIGSLILETGTRAVFHTILLFSVYLLFAGHNAPGGGFIGGLVAGSALVLRYIAEGSESFRRLLPVAPPSVLGLGVVLAIAAGLGGFALGGAFLASDVAHLALPVFGEVHIASVLVFDVGVFLVVIGLVLMILETLGAEMDAGGSP